MFGRLLCIDCEPTRRNKEWESGLSPVAAFCQSRNKHHASCEQSPAGLSDPNHGSSGEQGLLPSTGWELNWE